MTVQAAVLGVLCAFCVFAASADDAIVKNTIKKSGAAKVSPMDASAGIAPASAPSVKDADKDVSKLPIGKIKSLTLSGSVDFAKTEGVKDGLERDLVDGKVKTVGDLQAAINACLKTLYARAFYLAAIYPASADAG